MTDRFTNRTRKPSTRGFRGVRALWSDGHRCWKFRAVFGQNGKRVVGSLRFTREEASDDYRKLVTRAKARPLRVETLSDAIRSVIADARDRGVRESTIRQHHESHGAYLLRELGEGTLLASIDVERVQEWIRAALSAEKPRTARTIVEKDLPLLHQAFLLAKLDSPIPEVKRRMASRLKVTVPRPRFFRPEELRTLLDRMRDEEFRDDDGRVVELPARLEDADLVEFIACTGVRAGELGRVLITDVDLELGIVHVAEAKDRAHPRDLVVPPSVRPVAERLLERARRLEASGSNPHRLFVPRAVFWIGNINRRWQDRLGDPRLCGRTLRHTFVTGVITSGATAAEARDLAGHRHLSTTDRYVHAVGAARAAVAGRWADRLSGSAS